MRFFRNREIELQTKLFESEKAALVAEIALLKEHVARCERVIDIERQRVENERERADRLNDAILQQNGLPNVTSTGLNEQAKLEEKRRSEQEQRLREVIEIGADQLNNLYDMSGVELPPDLQAEMDALLGK